MASREMIDRMFKNLLPIYPLKGKHDEVREVWMYVLSDVDDLALKKAVKEYMATDAAYFPKPGKLRGIVERDRPVKSVKMDAHVLEDYPCPTCGAVARWLTPAEWGYEPLDGARPDFEPPEQFGILHDRRKHLLAGAVIVGFSR